MKEGQPNKHEEQFIQNLSNYIHNLQSCKANLLQLKIQPPSRSAVDLFFHKIDLEIGKYHNTLMKLKSKIMTPGAIKTLREYIYTSYNNIVKEYNTVMQAKDLKKDVRKKVRDFEEELENEWNKNDKSDTVQLDISKNRQNLGNLAKEQLEKQFLMIRMIAYKMYEDYTSHSHQEMRETLNALKDEQNKLRKELNEAKSRKVELEKEERRLNEEMREIKKVNEVVGRRYFVSNCHSETDFTSI